MKWNGRDWVDSEALSKMLIPKEKFRYRMRRGATFADAEANSLKKIQQNKDACDQYWHMRILERAFG